MKYLKLSLAILSLLLCPSSVLAQWNIQTVDNSGETGLYSSIASDSHGYPHIAYYDSTRTALMYAYWTGSGWHIETVDNSDWGGSDNISKSGEYCSLAIDTQDRPHISYYIWHRFYIVGQGDHYWGKLRYATKGESGWQMVDVQDGGTDQYVGLYTSIALWEDQGIGAVVPHMSYYYSNTGKLYHAYYNISTLSWVKEVVDGASNVGGYTSIAVDANQHIYISYYDFDGQDLKYAYYDGVVWSTVIVDGTGDVGKYSSLALDDSNVPHIAYYDATNKNLKYATLSGKSGE
jgi:hypothetical protein